MKRTNLLLFAVLALVSCSRPTTMTEQQVNFKLDSIVSIYELRLATTGKKEVKRVEVATVAPPDYQGQEAERQKDIDASIAMHKANQKPLGTVKTPMNVSPPTGEVFTDKKGNEYPVHVGAKGGRYILKTSSKGNIYKQYLKN